MISIFFANPYTNNYYHFLIDMLRPLYEYMEVHQLMEKDVMLYCDLKDQYRHVLDLLQLRYESASKLPEGAIEIRKHDACKDERFFKTLCPDPTPARRKIVFIRREYNEKKRNILNEGECLASLCDEFGDVFDIVPVSFESMPFEAQIEMVKDCFLLVGAHGAGFTNCIFMPKGSHILELFPECFYLEDFRHLCQKRSVHHHVLHGENPVKPPLSLAEYKKVPWSIKKDIIHVYRDVDYVFPTAPLLATTRDILALFEKKETIE